MSATGSTTAPVYEFTSDQVPGWNTGNTRWVTVEVFLSLVGLFVVLFMEWKNKEINIAGKLPSLKSSDNRQSEYVDSSEDNQSSPPANRPPNEDNPGRLAEGEKSTTQHYHLIQEFWLLMFWHGVSLVVGMRHSAQGLTVIFAYIHFLLIGGYVYFHVKFNFLI